LVITQVIELVHPQSMSKEQSGARQSRIESRGGDVPDASHSHASNAAFGSKKKSGTLTERSRGLLMAAVFLFMYTALTLLQETKSLLSATMSPEFDHNEASGVTDALPNAIAPHPMIPSTNWKVGTLSGVDQAEMEVATIRVEQDRQDAPAEEEKAAVREWGAHTTRSFEFDGKRFLDAFVAPTPFNTSSTSAALVMPSFNLRAQKGEKKRRCRFAHNQTTDLVLFQGQEVYVCLVPEQALLLISDETPTIRVLPSTQHCGRGTAAPSTTLSRTLACPRTLSAVKTC
jgi:hypothetical protein